MAVGIEQDPPPDTGWEVGPRQELRQVVDEASAALPRDPAHLLSLAQLEINLVRGQPDLPRVVEAMHLQPPPRRLMEVITRAQGRVSRLVADDGEGQIRLDTAAEEF